MEDLTLKQLESLAIEYFECRLSREEEDDLKKVLLFSPHHSELLDQCRLAMGMEATIRDSRRQTRNRKMARWLAVAASVVLIVCATTLLLRDSGSGLPDTKECYYAEAYVNGVKITDKDAAMRIAEQNRRTSLTSMDSLFYTLMNYRDRQLDITSHLINKTPRN